MDQVKRHQGLADKNDDMIEKAHQPWKREKARTWIIKNFKQGQSHQLGSARKRSHYLIEAKLSFIAAKRRRKTPHATTEAAAANAIVAKDEEARKRLAFGSVDPIYIDSSSSIDSGDSDDDSDSLS